MKSGISRRTLLELAGGAVIGSGALEVGCSRARPAAAAPADITHRVNLICYGMLGFYCDGTNIHILVPLSPFESCNGAQDGSDAHAVLFGDSVGASQSALQPMNDLHTPTGLTYTLAFKTGIASPGNKFVNAKVLRKSNLVLYNDKYKVTINPDPMQYLLEILVPYPSKVRAYRGMQYGSAAPYLTGPGTGQTVGVFGQPTVLSGVSVLTYDFSTAPDPVQLTVPGANAYTFNSATPKRWNLHLYSQPAPFLLAISTPPVI